MAMVERDFDHVLRAEKVDGCVFCDPDKIATEIEWVKRWGWRFMVFEPLGPVTPGHVLVVPEFHVQDATRSVAIAGVTAGLAAEIASRYEAANLITNVGRAATQSVMHLHWHVVPRIKGDGLALPWSRPAVDKYDAAVREAAAAGLSGSARESAIRSSLAGERRSAGRRLPLHRTEANAGVECGTCEGGGCPDCTDPA